jgi:hypothetical protein
MVHQLRICYARLDIRFAGIPAQISPAGIFFVTTAPAPTTALEPMVTPFSTTTLQPNQTQSPITISAFAPGVSCFINFLTSDTVIMVNKFTAGSNRTALADGDSFLDVEFTSASDKNTITNDDGWPRTPDAVELKENVRFQNTFVPDLDLVRPGDGYFGNNRMLSNFDTTKP